MAVGRRATTSLSNGATRALPPPPEVDAADSQLRDLLHALQAMKIGDFSVRLPGDQIGIMGKIADAFNDIVISNERMADQLARVGEAVGREGKTRNRARFGANGGAWTAMEQSVNTLIDDLLWPTNEISRSIAAVAQGDLLQTVRLEVDGRPLKGEFLRSAKIVNTMIRQLSIFTSEVTRVAREVGTEGKLGGQAQVPGVAGTWKDLTDTVNVMAANLTEQVRGIVKVVTAVANGDLKQNLTVKSKGEVAALAETINNMTDTLATFAEQVTSVAREVGVEGRLGGQAHVPGAAGAWKDLTGNVNLLAANLTTQVRAIAEVATAVTKGDLTRSIQVDARGEVAELSDNINTMIEELEQRVADRTKELEDAIKRQELLAREVDHRAKNALAVVQSIVRLTKGGDIRQFSDAVHGRIRAMANVHTLLSESRWAGADLARLVDEELAPFQSQDRARTQGPSVALRPPVAQGVAMAIHELATNAAKYGALSNEKGRVHLRWRMAGGAVVLDWEETGGPKTTPPASVGFGTKVIEASVAGQSNGQVGFEWLDAGLRCRLVIPDATEAGPTLRHEPRQELPAGETAAALQRLAGARVLLAEDEPLIAMMIAEVLYESGAKVVGPFSSVGGALECDEPFDVALLDVNLDGQKVYPVAEKLQASGRPFVFATGYDDASVEGRFAQAVVLQKPIEPAVLTEALGRALLGR